jgi:23S rRNA-/tRNA-specific pseudouridylate synthase
VHTLCTPTHTLTHSHNHTQLVAKTKRAYVELQRQFAKRLIKKEYHALVEGCVDGEQGTIDLMVDEKESVSEWKVVSRSRSASLGDTHLTLLQVHPKHGRKHQIRIHCADALGCSIVGDRHHRGTLVGQVGK